jgi:hypothetical protein
MLLICLLLTSCGGAGGAAVAGGGIDGTGIMSAGVVTAFGSIEVNGTDFDTTNAVVVFNGVEVGVGDDVVTENLRIGMVVSVEGRIMTDGNVVADRVFYSNNVVGPIETINPIDATTKEITVLGQIVVINVITEIEPETYGFDSIALNDVVRVSGYRDNNGNIRATYLEDITDLNLLVFEVTGVVELLNPAAQQFKINDLTVDYALIDRADLPPDFENESFVEVRGEFVGGELIALEIEPGDRLDGDDGNEFEIMGFVTTVVSEFEFSIGNQVVIIDENTVVVDELPGGIQPGVKLEAEGVFEGGVLFADEIEFWKPDQIEVEGVVDEVVFVDDYPEFTFEERQDQLFVTSEEIGTEFEDIEKEDIEIGIELEVKGRPLDPEQNVIEADKVSFEIE